MEPDSAAVPADSVESGQASAVRATAELRLALLLGTTGRAFAGDGVAVARAAIEQAVARDVKLRNYPLANADEAAGSFVPYRASAREGTQ